MYVIGLLWGLSPPAAVLLGLLRFALVKQLLYVCSMLCAWLVCFTTVKSCFAKQCSLKTKQSNILWNTLKSFKSCFTYNILFQTVIDIFQYTLNYSNRPTQIYSTYVGSVYKTMYNLHFHKIYKSIIS